MVRLNGGDWEFCWAQQRGSNEDVVQALCFCCSSLPEITWMCSLPECNRPENSHACQSPEARIPLRGIPRTRSRRRGGFGFGVCRQLNFQHRIGRVRGFRHCLFLALGFDLCCVPWLSFQTKGLQHKPFSAKVMPQARAPGRWLLLVLCFSFTA